MLYASFGHPRFLQGYLSRVEGGGTESLHLTRCLVGRGNSKIRPLLSTPAVGVVGVAKLAVRKAQQPVMHAKVTRVSCQGQKLQHGRICRLVARPCRLLQHWICLIKSNRSLETASTWLLPHISWQGGYMLLPADQGMFPDVD